VVLNKILLDRTAVLRGWIEISYGRIKFLLFYIEIFLDASCMKRSDELSIAFRTNPRRSVCKMCSVCQELLLFQHLILGSCVG
jgi:hypothetical protein